MVSLAVVELAGPAAQLAGPGPPLAPEDALITAALLRPVPAPAQVSYSVSAIAIAAWPRRPRSWFDIVSGWFRRCGGRRRFYFLPSECTPAKAKPPAH